MASLEGPIFIVRQARHEQIEGVLQMQIGGVVLRQGPDGQTDIHFRGNHLALSPTTRHATVRTPNIEVRVQSMDKVCFLLC